jgi:hypothetical protein
MHFVSHSGRSICIPMRSIAPPNLEVRDRRLGVAFPPWPGRFRSSFCTARLIAVADVGHLHLDRRSELGLEGTPLRAGTGRPPFPRPVQAAQPSPVEPCGRRGEAVRAWWPEDPKVRWVPCGATRRNGSLGCYFTCRATTVVRHCAAWRVRYRVAAVAPGSHRAP